MLRCSRGVLEPRIRAWSPPGNIATAKRMTTSTHGVIVCAVITPVSREIFYPRRLQCSPKVLLHTGTLLELQGNDVAGGAELSPL